MSEPLVVTKAMVFASLDGMMDALNVKGNCISQQCKVLGKAVTEHSFSDIKNCA